MRAAIALLLFLALWLPVPTCRAADDAQLLKVVVLSRHGVRSPTQTAKTLSAWSQREWPKWPVPRGELTNRGAELVKAMWANVRPMFDSCSLMEKGSCPQVYVRADVDERTQATAQALLDGVAPGCHLSYEMVDGKLDPLFHPVKAGLYRYDAIVVATDVLARTRGGIDRLLNEFSSSMSLLSQISGSPAPEVCTRFALRPNCQITDLPNAISVSSDGSSIRLVGSLDIASCMAEIFLLEYAQWPGQTPGWGEVSTKLLEEFLPIHAAVFDVVNRASLVAWANGSALLREMTSALLGDHSNKAINDAKLVVFVGHDTNIANVAGLLALNWHVNGFPVNSIPPGAAFFLELWRDQGLLKIIPRFYNQNIAALHKPMPEVMTGETLQAFEPISVHMSGVQEVTYYSPAEFKALVEKLTADAPIPGPQNMQAKNFQWINAVQKPSSANF